MPYHVRLRMPDQHKPSQFLHYFDLSEEQLEKRVLIPYRNGEDIKNPSGQNHAEIIHTDEIQALKIVQTEDPSYVLKNKYGPITWYKLYDFGVDVTSQKLEDSPSREKSTDTLANASTAEDTRKVFVVHGRNLKARDALFTFLRSIGLQPIEWSQAIAATGKSSPYIGEILDAAFSDAQAVVVLMTPDDEACLREEFRRSDDPSHEIQLTGQARPNVLFEAGMAIDRFPDRTVLIELGTLRPFSDIGGRHVIRLDNSAQRRQELAHRLQLARCAVDLSGTDWHTAGDFVVSDQHSSSRNPTGPIEKPYPQELKSRIENGELDIELDMPSLRAYMDSSGQHLRWMKTAVQVGFRPFESLADENKKRLTLQSEERLITVSHLAGVSTIRALDELLKDASEWGKDALANLCRIAHQLTDRPIAVPNYIVMLLVLLAKEVKDKYVLEQASLSPGVSFAFYTRATTSE